MAYLRLRVSVLILRMCRSDGDTRKDRTMAKAYANGQRRSAFWADERATKQIKAAQEAYSKMLGRPVSGSLVVRRGLELLTAHLATLPPAVAEMAALARHMR